MRKLSKYEKETIINWNEGETIASIYTFNASLKRIFRPYPVCYPIGSKRRVGQYKRKGWLPCFYPDRYGTGILHLLF